MKVNFTHFTIAMASIAIASGPVSAKNKSDKGHVQLKIFGTYVTTNDKIKSIGDPSNLIGSVGIAGARSKVTDNVVPTIAVEYFLKNSISFETICCTTEHTVNGDGTLDGANLASNIKILPATFTVKYHFPLKFIKPYIGVGPSYFFFIGEKPGATAVALGASRNVINDKFGVALQGGFDVPLNSKFFFSTDVKKVFLTTTSRWYDPSGAEVLNARVALDPWVISAGFGIRF